MQPGDEDAIKCKVVCLIKLEQFSEAISFLDATPSNNLSFEKAYCFYKTKKLDEALAVINAIPSPKPVSVLELEAQVVLKENYFAH